MLCSRTQVSSLRLLGHRPTLRSWRLNSTLELTQEPPSNTQPSLLQQPPTNSRQFETTLRKPSTVFEPEKERQPPLRGRHSAFIRTWDFIQSPADAFAIIRAVERKYGRISEYRFQRDYEIPTGYQAIIYVLFRSQESFNLIPQDAEVFHIPAPPTIPDRPGGIGLDELDGLLVAKGKDEAVDVPDFGSVMSSVIESEEEVKKGSRRMIGCRIQRSATEFYTPSRVPAFGPSRRIRESIARNFINWGGFHEFLPIERTVPIMESMLSVKSNIDHIRMRQCLRKSSQLVNVPNPYEIRTGSDIPAKLSLSSQSSTGETTVTGIQPLAESEDIDLVQHAKQSVPIEWEPLPGFESVSEGDYIPTPSGIAAALEQSGRRPRQTQSTVSTAPSTSALSQPIPKQPTSDPKFSVDEMSDTTQRMKPTIRGQPRLDYSEETAAQLRAAKNLLQQEKQQQQARQQQKGTAAGRSEKGGKGKKEGERPGGGIVPKKRTWQPMKKPEQSEDMTERWKSLIGSWF